MAAAAFHTTASFKALQKAGFNQQKTFAILDAVLVLETHNNAELATKHDLNNLEQRLEHKIDKVQTELNHLGAKLTIRLGAIVVGTATLLPYLTDLLHLPRP